MDDNSFHLELWVILSFDSCFFSYELYEQWFDVFVMRF